MACTSQERLFVQIPWRQDTIEPLVDGEYNATARLCEPIRVRRLACETPGTVWHGQPFSLPHVIGPPPLTPIRRLTLRPM